MVRGLVGESVRVLFPDQEPRSCFRAIFGLRENCVGVIAFPGIRPLVHQTNGPWCELHGTGPILDFKASTHKNDREALPINRD